jgi:hypothetical protein
MKTSRKMPRDSSSGDTCAAAASVTTERANAAGSRPWNAASSAALILVVASLLSFAAGSWTARACFRLSSGSLTPPPSKWKDVLMGRACQRPGRIRRAGRGFLLDVQVSNDDIRSTADAYPPSLPTKLFESRQARRRRILHTNEGAADDGNDRNLSRSGRDSSSLCQASCTSSSLPPTTTAETMSKRRDAHHGHLVEDSEGARMSTCKASSNQHNTNRRTPCGDPHKGHARPILVDAAALLESWIYPTRVLVHEAATASASAPLRVAVLVGTGPWDAAHSASILKHEFLLPLQSILPQNATIAVVDASADLPDSPGDDPECNRADTPGIGGVRVRDVYDWITGHEPHGWDIIYVDGSILHGDQHASDSSSDLLLQALARALSPSGVVSLWMQGPAQRLGNFESTCAFHSVLESAHGDFRYIVDYHEAVDRTTLDRHGHHRSRLVNYFGLLMKEEGGGARHARWRFASHAHIDLTLRKLLRAEAASLLSYLDGATMMTYKFPSRLDEELYCRRHWNRNTSSACDALGHGIDPAPSDYMSEAMEVRTSTYGERSGRGVYATRDIPAKSYVTLRDCAEALVVPPPSVQLFWDALDAFGTPYVRSMFAFLDGYGWFDTSQVRTHSIGLI